MGILSTIGSILGGPVTAGISLGTDILGHVIGNYQQNKANNANMELAKYQFDRNLDMWNKQNEYNTPKNQMARYTEAGLNPNLIYSQGTPGVASNAPQYQAPEIRKYQNFGDFGVMAAGQLAQQQRQVSSTIELQAAQAASEKARARNIEADTNVKSIDHLSRLLKYGIDKETRSAVVGSIRQNLENLKKTGENIESSTNLNNQRNTTEIIKRNEIQSRCDNLRAQNAKIESDIRLNDAKISLINKQAEEVAERALLISAEEKGVTFNNDLNGLVKDYLVESARQRLLKLTAEAQKAGKEVDWYEYNRIMGDLIGVASAIGGIRKPTKNSVTTVYDTSNRNYEINNTH